MEEKVYKQIGFTLDMLKKVDDYAYKLRMSRAEFVRKAVEYFLKNNDTK